jgi:CheY-like chemotaxis protein
MNSVLVIDDIPSNITLILDLLEPLGIRVSGSTEGRSGITKAIKLHPDLIVLDIMMPKMDGFEICKALTTHPQTKSIPIIFMTVLSDPKYIARGFQAGARDYIVKPFLEEELIARIKVHLYASGFTQEPLNVSNAGLILEEVILLLESVEDFDIVSISPLWGVFLLLFAPFKWDEEGDFCNVSFILKYYLLYLP